MESVPIKICEVGRQDLPQLLDLYQHLVPGDDSPSPQAAEGILRQFLGYTGSAIFAGWVGGDLVASCVLVVVPNLTRGGSPYGLIENVVTHAGFRRRGFGKTILDHATEAAWAVGCYKVMLLTGSQKAETLQFYRDAGFEQSKTGFQKRRITARSTA